MKKIIELILCLVFVFSCAAFAEEDGQSLAMEIIGDYNDQFSQRAFMHVECGAETDKAFVQISWSGSAEENTVWDLSGTVEVQDGGYVIRYSDCVKRNVTADGDETEGTSETVYENGTGTIAFAQDGIAIWQDDMEDAGRDCVFTFDAHEDEVFTAAGVQMGASEADVRAALGDPAEENAVDGGKELVYNGLKLNNVEVEGHYIIMDDTVRAMGFATHNGDGDVANDISVFIADSGNDIDADVSEERTQQLGTKYFGLKDFSQLTYFSRYAYDGTELVYLRTSGSDIYLIALDQYLQEQ